MFQAHQIALKIILACIINCISVGFFKFSNILAKPRLDNWMRTHFHTEEVSWALMWPKTHSRTYYELTKKMRQHASAQPPKGGQSKFLFCTWSCPLRIRSPTVTCTLLFWTIQNKVLKLRVIQPTAQNPAENPRNFIYTWLLLFMATATCIFCVDCSHLSVKTEQRCDRWENPRDWMHL